MAITSSQKKNADKQQMIASCDSSPQVRLVAGPGTGKSGTIIKRVMELLKNGVNPDKIYVISFTRATCLELANKIISSCTNTAYANAPSQIHVSTMHSLALRILRRANLLIQFPSDPTLLNEWEQDNIYDEELSRSVPCTPTRAGEIRVAHDAQWQTLNPQYINQTQISPIEIRAFNAFHSTRTNLYSCVLPGEVVFKCVEAYKMGTIQKSQIPLIEHLIVDEFQDLNACDQEFIHFLSSNGGILFVAGDDDQSIYSFRHADPSGIMQFHNTYPHSNTHILSDCFRCTPSILNAATTLIQFNANRIPKTINPLYSKASPPVTGSLFVWSFSDAVTEAKSIASSIQELLKAGLAGREDEIVILITNRRLQLDIITQELGNLGLPFEPPRGKQLTDDIVIHAVYSILRICKENIRGKPDYIAYRSLLGLLSGIGITTVKDIADGCVANNQNFRALFDMNPLPHWLKKRADRAVSRVIDAAQTARSWSHTDTIGSRIQDINGVLSTNIVASNQLTTLGAQWTALAGALPQNMTLDELLLFLSTDSESDQQLIIDQVNSRISKNQLPGTVIQKNIRVLTMHGAIGLSGKVVFIPACEQGIMPNFYSLQATGLVIEQRRLFYVSLTRAMAACILSHAALHVGAQAFFLRQTMNVRLPRSQFLNELGIASVNRTTGLSPTEALAIVTDINNL